MENIRSLGNIAAFIGGLDDEKLLLNFGKVITAKPNSLAESETVFVEKELQLTTRYYSCSVTVLHFGSIEEAITHFKENNVDEIGALIYRTTEGDDSFQNVKNFLQVWSPEISIMLCDRLNTSSKWGCKVKQFCDTERVEVVEMNPSEETIAELEEYREFYGVNRIMQATYPVASDRLCSTSNDIDEFGEYQCSSSKVLQEKTDVSASEDHLKGSSQSAVPKHQGKPTTNVHLVKPGNLTKDKQPQLEEDNIETNSTAEQLVKIRSKLASMDFGPERQNYAADVMQRILESLGDDFLNDNSSESDDS
uniref:Alpha-and gamma-adaptin-binding protein p34 n=1 Tax=Syphacia muris TaxID=451379 RepID=A0A158R5Y6_9BILA